MKKIVLVISILFGIYAHGQGFLHTDGQRIVDGNGKNVLLKGLGLGGWMVQEGYMLQTADFAGPQHIIKQKISELVGEEGMEKFYDAYLASGITKRDIDSLKSWGFNSVRLPMHYNLYTPPIEAEKDDEITWLEKGFEMTDNLLKWCEDNEMYLILDLHAAPGGQGHDANISDYDATKPSLWESEANQQKMIAFWEKIAERYKDEPWIGGYDIINEPNWNFEGENPNGCDEEHNAPLRKLMVDVTTAIRKIDKNHIVVIEGNCWGNNYNGIFPLWDDNTVISFHKYWNYNTTASIEQVLGYREKYNAPIWLGESGENSNVWFRDALALMESHNIGWAFWPMKKVNNIAGVTNVTKNDGFATLLEYWKNGGEKPSRKFAIDALMKLADNYKMENVTVKPGVVDAMFRQVGTFETKAYKEHGIPGKIYATEYDMGTNNYAYKDRDYVNYWVSTGERVQWNKGRKMRNDGVDIQVSTDNITNGYEVFDINEGEWLQFTVDVAQTGTYVMDVRYSSEAADGKFYLSVDGNRLSESLTLPITGGNTQYRTYTSKGYILEEGIHHIKIIFETGGFNLNYMEFKKQ
ncbi:cellulase family glycosylhydrolase [Muricauda sp. HICW]|uniref:Cellulase family glycosylhydrolase n=1 Tax=Flagellimonas chongwuensis TaxID=2697365 RepID=A0A850NKZ4_9FLAO|nr:cellulase family glycosylhydrolase [Allomuricauda chongwuensis]NVN19045.1 cellulase family glycosylhydrolase [Allomuricauda chongwuensis]